jgi:predicted glycoside hydrolase/deacetylase ChbG (UPF0249 family)
MGIMNFTPNPVLRKLGYSDHDRLVIIHTDDIGMCEASVSAFDALWQAGAISSGSVMAPCPWFAHAAAWCHAHPDVDMGVHIALTSEWNAYRWGPISSRDPATGMLDNEGYFPRASRPVQEKGDPVAVAREMEAQVQRAIAAGIRPTHIDTHMGTVMHPKFLGAYLHLGLRYGMPAMMPRVSEDEMRERGLSADEAAGQARTLAEMEDAGIPLVDHIAGMPLDMNSDHFEVAKRAFDQLHAGVTHFLLHPSTDTPELRALAPDWRGRVENLHTFLRTDLREHLRHIGVHVIGYRALQDLMPPQRSGSPV